MEFENEASENLQDKVQVDVPVQHEVEEMQSSNKEATVPVNLYGLIKVNKS